MGKIIGNPDNPGSEGITLGYSYENNLLNNSTSIPTAYQILTLYNSDSEDGADKPPRIYTTVN